MQADADTRQAEHPGMRQEVTLLAASFGTEIAFIEPEILQIGTDKLRQFVSSEPRLTSHRFYVEEILRTAAHTLSEPEEKILATAAPVTAAPSTSSVWGVATGMQAAHHLDDLGETAERRQRRRAGVWGGDHSRTSPLRWVLDSRAPPGCAQS